MIVKLYRKKHKLKVLQAWVGGLFSAVEARRESLHTGNRGLDVSVYISLDLDFRVNFDPDKNLNSGRRR